VLCTHLGCDASGVEQTLQVEEIDAFVRRALLLPPPPPLSAASAPRARMTHVVLCADMNAPPSAPPLQLAAICGWQDAFAAAARAAPPQTLQQEGQEGVPAQRALLRSVLASSFAAAGATFPSAFPLARLDYILFRSFQSQEQELEQGPPPPLPDASAGASGASVAKGNPPRVARWRWLPLAGGSAGDRALVCRSCAALPTLASDHLPVLCVLE
jgi:endonuclease/exonuclease/phosphatase family metal-dependent hydrolase